MPAIVQISKHYKDGVLDVIEYRFPPMVTPKFVRQIRGRIIQEFGPLYRRNGQALFVDYEDDPVRGYKIVVHSLWKRKHHQNMFPFNTLENTGNSDREWLVATRKYWEQGHGSRLALERSKNTTPVFVNTPNEVDIVPTPAVKQLDSQLIEA